MQVTRHAVTVSQRFRYIEETPNIRAIFVLFGAAHSALGQTVTFNADIAPLVYTHCVICHHKGGSGPFPLLTYDDVAKHAAQIVSVTASRYMPPWPPESGYGKFKGDRSLTPQQIALLAAWLKQGKQQGAESALPAAPQFTSEWQMGPPDLILRMPAAFHLPASGPDLFRNFVLPSGVHQVRYVRGFELRMNNPRAVHHANVILDRTQSLRRRDGEDGQPGFPGMDVITEAAADNFDPDSHFLFWKPASVLTPEADDMSWRLDPQTDLILNLHLQPTGKAETVQAEIGIYFAAHPPTLAPMLVQLEHDGALHIPPASKDFAVTDELTLPVDAQVLAVYPHAHYLGKVLEAWAVLPNGARRWLIRIPNWDINWQAVYEYEKPVDLPKGTKIEMRISYDNTASNPRNPNHPPKLVVAGNRSEDEMGHIWFQLLPKPNAGAEDPRLAIQEAVMRRRLEKYPADFLAQYNLAALLQMRGRYAEAAAVYRKALQSEPANVTAHNSLATALLSQEDVPGAIAEFRETLRLDPKYLNARYNLARTLAVSGDLHGASQEYAAFLKDKPDDADAQAGLGTIDFKQRNYGDALIHFREAARLDPHNADTQTNLGALLAMRGELIAAKDAFENALRIDPEHEAARANLERVKAKLGGK
jgi:tetratricopeptide (TPR) repeat protein/mono/diheme cytochrome c family protein